MISALFSFLGGTAFRMIWGEVSSWLTARQEHRFELDRMKIQAELDAAQHDRNLQSLRVQADMGIKTIQVQGEQAANQIEIEGWAKAVAASQKPTGIRWVDAWNAIIRPSFATVALVLWILILYRQGFAPTTWDLDLIGAVAGFFFADRSLGKRNK